GTRRWEEFPAQMERALARHCEIIEAAVVSNRGRLVRSRGEGDSTFSVFDSASGAIGAACELQLALNAEVWPKPVHIRVRAAIHTGSAVPFHHDFNSSDVNRCARIRALAYGGQTLVSDAACLQAKVLPAGASLFPLGSHRLKDLSRPEALYQLTHSELPADFPPLRSLDTLPTNLPQQLTSFIGRDHEISEVRTLIGRSKLVTLT